MSSLISFTSSKSIMDSWIDILHKDYLLDSLKAVCCDWYEFCLNNKIPLTLTTVALAYGILLRKLSHVKKEDYKRRPHIRTDAPYDGEESEPIDLSGVTTISGWFQCKLFRLLYNTPLSAWLNGKAKKKLKRDILDNVIFPEKPTFLPLVKGDSTLYEREQVTAKDLWKICDRVDSDREDTFQFVSISDLIHLYREGKETPESVLQTLIKCLKQSEGESPSLRCFTEYYEDKIMEQAVASTKRWKEGKPLSVFDGIPVGVKEDYILGDHHARNGLPSSIDCKKAEVSDEKGLVKRLREGGAIIIGMLNMHQHGLGVTGINQSKYHGTCRNPYNIRYPSGGSSSGSASAVAAGLSVVCLGGDGGGSIRLPAACCGIVGLKATYGSYSNAGKISNSCSVGHSGALCSSIRDTAITYGFLAGKDEDYPDGLIQPPVYLGDFDCLDLSGMKVGIDRQWLESADPEIQACCENVLKWLKDIYGASVIDVHVPEKVETILAQGTAIVGEMTSNNKILKDVYYNDVNIDILAMYEMGSTISVHDYLQANKQRTRSINALKYIFSQVDVVLTPGFFSCLPELKPSMLTHGYADVSVLKNVWLHTLMNLTGVPGITLPIDYTSENLPLAVQFFSSWWREDTLLKVAYAIERCVKRNKPNVYYKII